MKVEGEMTIAQPRQVSGVNQKDFEVSKVCATDAATVVLSTNGDAFVLHEYHCRRIVSR